MVKKIVVPAMVDIIQSKKKILNKPEIRVWCEQKKGDDYYIVFENTKDAFKFIKKNKYAEKNPLFAFNGFEMDLFNIKVKNVK